MPKMCFTPCATRVSTKASEGVMRVMCGTPDRGMRQHRSGTGPVIGPAFSARLGQPSRRDSIFFICHPGRAAKRHDPGPMVRVRNTDGSYGSRVAQSLSLGRAVRGPEGLSGMTVGEA